MKATRNSKTPSRRTSAKADSQRITYHDDKSSLFGRLPFVAAERPKDAPPDWPAWWALPAGGGVDSGISSAAYGNGCTGGQWSATAYLKALRAAENITGGGYLQMIVLDMGERLRLAPPDSREFSDLRGQIVGFFSTLEPWLHRAARALGHRLDAISEAEVCEKIQDAVDGGPEQRYLASIKQANSDAARTAANARWARVKRDREVRHEGLHGKSERSHG